ncbi:hypothetical protein BN3658_00397 [Coriobacteriaceae bacterium CHKCI002]|nr:hypothetical protein BN3658_00397 [Coriobacteriaceae bacterium CHKCI002]
MYFPFVLEGFEIVFYGLFYGVPLAYCALNLRYVKKIAVAVIGGGLRYVLYCYAALLAMSILVPIFHGTYDLSFFSEGVLSIVKESPRMIFLMVVFAKYISPKCDFILFARYFVWSMCCYVLGTCLFVLLPDLKAFWYGVVKDSEHSREVALQADYFTRYGWSGFSGFAHTFKCVLGIVLSCYFLSREVKRIGLKDFAAPLLLLLGTFFYGRIGMLVAVLVAIVFVFFVLLKKRPMLTTRLAVGVVVLCIVLVAGALTNEQIALWFDWAFAVLINFFSTGQLESASTKILFEDMLFIPPLDTWMIGDGRYSGDVGYYMNTDSGLMRPLLFGGILFCVLRYALLAFLVGYLWMSARKCKDRPALFCVALLCMAVLIFEIKGEVVFVAVTVLMPLAAMYSMQIRTTKDG